MFETLKRPLKVFGECDPNNVWYEKWDNGTFFKGSQLFELWQFQSKFEKGIEIITQVSKSSKIHPAVNTISYQKFLAFVFLKFTFYLDKNSIKWDC